LTPAWKAIVGYAENFSPLTQADIAAIVSKADARALKRQRLEVRSWDSSILADYPEAINIPSQDEILRTPLAIRSQAQAVVRNWLARLNPDRSGGVLLNGGRDALSVELGDEVRIVTERYGMSNGLSYIVIQQRPKYASLNADLELWGGKAPSVEGATIVSQDGITIVSQDGEVIIAQS
jgi:hypothetical protein